MDITVGKPPIDGMREMRIRFHEVIDEFGFAADVTVWVEDCDSVSDLHERALNRAREFLLRAINSPPD